MTAPAATAPFSGRYTAAGAIFRPLLGIAPLLLAVLFQPTAAMMDPRATTKPTMLGFGTQLRANSKKYHLAHDLDLMLQCLDDQAIQSSTGRGKYAQSTSPLASRPVSIDDHAR